MVVNFRVRLLTVAERVRRWAIVVRSRARGKEERGVE
jgi:hypothetical protein